MVSLKYCVQNTISAKNDSIREDKRYCKTLENDDDFLIDNENFTKYGKNCEALHCQEDLEIDEDSNAIHRNTLWHVSNTYANDPEYPTELTFAPGEGHTPVSIFDDVDVEYLAFPTIFCGQRQKENIKKLNYSDICKYELQSVDGCVTKNVPNVFFKFKKVQTKSVLAEKSLAVW